jgi:hypothetical protein
MGYESRGRNVQSRKFLIDHDTDVEGGYRFTETVS